VNHVAGNSTTRLLVFRSSVGAASARAKWGNFGECARELVFTRRAVHVTAPIPLTSILRSMRGQTLLFGRGNGVKTDSVSPPAATGGSFGSLSIITRPLVISSGLGKVSSPSTPNGWPTYAGRGSLHRLMASRSEGGVPPNRRNGGGRGAGTTETIVARDSSGICPEVYRPDVAPYGG
jgi:hypothetical protein